MTELDYGTLLCSATNKIGKQKHPCIFHIIAAGKVVGLAKTEFSFTISEPELYINTQNLLFLHHRFSSEAFSLPFANSLCSFFHISFQCSVCDSTREKNKWTYNKNNIWWLRLAAWREDYSAAWNIYGHRCRVICPCFLVYNCVYSPKCCEQESYNGNAESSSGNLRVFSLF